MDEKTLELIESARKNDPHLERLYHAHNALNRRVDELNDIHHLTADEELELHRLKKEKLSIRDQIEQIVHRRQSA